jgi:branched-subunit amino acid transport protein
MSEVLVVHLVAAGSYALRASSIVLAARHPIPRSIEGLLDNVKPAALAALAATAAVSHGNLSAAHVLALLVAGLAAHMGADLLGALVLGMLTLAAGSALL